MATLLSRRSADTAFGGIPMKCKSAGELEDRGSSRVFGYVKIFIICATLVMFACFLLLPLFAIGVFASMIGGFIGSLFAGFEALAYAILLPLAFAIWFLLTGDWYLLVWLLFELLAWLLSVGLL